MNLKQLLNIINTKTPIINIVSAHRYDEFWEVTGDANGDTLSYRVYNDGTVVEK